jgi:hypothetical protein
MKRPSRARPITFKVTKRGCWEVTSHKPMWGGYIAAHVDGRRQLLHRWSLEKKLGRPIGEGLFSLHSCDNPPCFNPDHLREGTKADNSRDRVIRGRRILPAPFGWNLKTGLPLSAPNDAALRGGEIVAAIPADPSTQDGVVRSDPRRRFAERVLPLLAGGTRL